MITGGPVSSSGADLEEDALFRERKRTLRTRRTEVLETFEFARLRSESAPGGAPPVGFLNRLPILVPTTIPTTSSPTHKNSGFGAGSTRRTFRTSEPATRNPAPRQRDISLSPPFQNA